MTRLQAQYGSSGILPFLEELKKRNRTLYWFGNLNFFGALICIILIPMTSTQVMGINAFIKPLKFFLSIGIFSFTMGWYLFYLKRQTAVIIYSWMVVVLMTVEHSIVNWQAANGRLSHFNISTPLYGGLFALMGILIIIFTLWTAFMGLLFFMQRDFDVSLSKSYVWGIRLGIVFFVIFAFQGGQMAANLAHTIGAPDGGQGLPLLNWSRDHGDLRVAHFFGMHSLQVLPLAGFYLFKSKKSIFIFSAIYFAFVVWTYWKAIGDAAFI